MRLVLDACVLFPTVMREVLLGAAEVGYFQPVWSPRLLEEWARAAARLGPEGEAVARGEIALVEARFPTASVTHADSFENRFWLPDPSDIHVLATAVKASADGIVTLNRGDFPKNILADEGLERIEPDGLLYSFWLDDPDGMEKVCAAVLARARALSGDEWSMRALLKKARLPRLAKAVSRT
ncbi:MAG: PIN domain-containing protein [Marivivens sp.]|nr:PIN domain-containing protein [Marivivens sp.]